MPERGRAADCYAVARTALYLDHDANIAHPEDGRPAIAGHASELHRISGALTSLRVRQCNEDVACPDCGGTGEGPEVIDPPAVFKSRKGRAAAARLGVGEASRPDCRRCKGTGLTVGPRLRKLEAAANEIAEHYGLRCYFQTDPRGCALYLIDPTDVPAHGEDLHRYAYGKPTPLAELQSRWIDANYSRGHAVVRLGR